MNELLNKQLEAVFPINMDEVIQRLAQVVAEDTQSKSHIRKIVRNEIVNSDELNGIYMFCAFAIAEYRSNKYYASKDARLEHIKAFDSYDIVIELAIAIMPHTKVTPIQVVANTLSEYFNYPDVFDGIKTASEIIAVCSESDLFNLYMPGKNMPSISVSSLYTLEDETLDFIAKTKFLDPMLIKPTEWTDNRTGGYITVENSVLLGKGHHEEYQCLDALNIIQGIELELDIDVLAKEEKSKKPLDTRDKQAAHAQLARNSSKTYQTILDAGNSFFFKWGYDSRGRMYSHGYYINLQSNEYKKASINTKRKQLIIG